MSIENQCKQMDIVIKRLKDMELYVLSDVVDYAKGKLISLSAELEEYQKATELSGKVNSKLMQELMDKPAVAVPDRREWNQAGGREDLKYTMGWNDCINEILAAPSHSQQSDQSVPLATVMDLRAYMDEFGKDADLDVIKSELGEMILRANGTHGACPSHESEQQNKNTEGN